MIWIYNFNPKFARTYYFRNPVTLPAGTRDRHFRGGRGSVTLLGPAGKRSGEIG